jgi:hypothetical protein
MKLADYVIKIMGDVMTIKNVVIQLETEYLQETAREYGISRTKLVQVVIENVVRDKLVSKILDNKVIIPCPNWSRFSSYSAARNSGEDVDSESRGIDQMGPFDAGSGHQRPDPRSIHQAEGRGQRIRSRRSFCNGGDAPIEMAASPQHRIEEMIEAAGWIKLKAVRTGGRDSAVDNRKLALYSR